MNKTLILLRGIPGSGKSTLAERLGHPYFEADQFFYHNGHYKFDASRLGEVHATCQARVKDAMLSNMPTIVVSNTSTTEREIEPYKKLADQYGYDFVSLIVENRHGNASVHNVPHDKLEAMKARFSIKL